MTRYRKGDHVMVQETSGATTPAILLEYGDYRSYIKPDDLGPQRYVWNNDLAGHIPLHNEGVEGRWELVRDDGDYSIGLGYSYSYYEKRNGTYFYMNERFDREYGPLLPGRWTKREIDAIEGRDNKDNHNLRFVRKIETTENGIII